MQNSFQNLKKITAKVVHGDAYGRTIGFPTANLDIPVAQTGIVPGVYAAFVRYNGTLHNAALIIHKAIERVEVHLLGQECDLYDQTLEITPIERVSDCMPFASEDSLIKKIKTDIQLIERVFEK